MNITNTKEWRSYCIYPHRFCWQQEDIAIATQKEYGQAGQKKVTEKARIKGLLKNYFGIFDVAINEPNSSYIALNELVEITANSWQPLPKDKVNKKAFQRVVSAVDKVDSIVRAKYSDGADCQYLYHELVLNDHNAIDQGSIIECPNLALFTVNTNKLRNRPYLIEMGAHHTIPTLSRYGFYRNPTSEGIALLKTEPGLNSAFRHGDYFIPRHTPLLVTKIRKIAATKEKKPIAKISVVPLKSVGN